MKVLDFLREVYVLSPDEKQLLSQFKKGGFCGE